MRFAPSSSPRTNALEKACTASKVNGGGITNRSRILPPAITITANSPPLSFSLAPAVLEAAGGVVEEEEDPSILTCIGWQCARCFSTHGICITTTRYGNEGHTHAPHK